MDSQMANRGFYMCESEMRLTHRERYKDPLILNQFRPPRRPALGDEFVRLIKGDWVAVAGEQVHDYKLRK